MGGACGIVVSLVCYVFVSVSGMHLYVTVLCFLCLSMYDEHLYTGQCCVHGTVVFMYLFPSGYCYASVCDNGVFVCVCFQGEVHTKALAICHQINTSASPFRPSESQYFHVYLCLMVLSCKCPCICT